MQSGEFVVERLLPRFVRQAAERRGIDYQAFSADWVLRLEKSEITRWVVGYKFDLNSAAASELAQDKVAMHIILKEAGIPSVQHVLVRSRPDEPLDLPRLQTIFGNLPVVLKPLGGTGGRRISKLSSVQLLPQQLASDSETAWAVSPYLELHAEYRVIVLQGKALAVYEKAEPAKRAGMRFFNLGMGARAVDITTSQTLGTLRDVALKVCRESGLQLAAVDIVRTAAGELLVLEVNDGLMMENYARQSGAHRARAADVYDAVVAAMFAD